MTTLLNPNNNAPKFFILLTYICIVHPATLKT